MCIFRPCSSQLAEQLKGSRCCGRWWLFIVRPPQWQRGLVADKRPCFRREWLCVFLHHIKCWKLFVFLQRNVYGRTCGDCLPGYYDLQEFNPDGCTQCFCFGVTQSCRASTLGRIRVRFTELCFVFTEQNHLHIFVVMVAQLGWKVPLENTLWSLGPGQCQKVYYAFCHLQIRFPGTTIWMRDTSCWRTD